MAGEKILVLEAPWDAGIEQTQATKDIYTSAETLLRVGPDPVRIIQRPIVSSTYRDDIDKFCDLECNQRGPNFIIFSAHGSVSRTSKRGKRFFSRKLMAFDGEVNLSAQIKDVAASLSRTIVILDSCDIGLSIESFYELSRAAGVIGFAEGVDWVDSTIFILGILLKFHGAGVMNQKRIRRTTRNTKSRQQRVLEEMTLGPWKSMAESLGIQSYFGP